MSIKYGFGAAGIVAGGTGVALVQVQMLDAQGRPVPTAANIVTFAVVGAGAEIIGTGNGDPQSHTPDKSLTREAFRGLVLAVVQSTPGAPSAGDGRAGSTPGVAISASSPGLAPSSVVVHLLPTDPATLELRL